MLLHTYVLNFMAIKVDTKECPNKIYCGIILIPVVQYSLVVKIVRCNLVVTGLLQLQYRTVTYFVKCSLGYGNPQT